MIQLIIGLWKHITRQWFPLISIQLIYVLMQSSFYFLVVVVVVVVVVVDTAKKGKGMYIKVSRTIYFLFPFFTFQNHKVLTIPHLLQHIFSWESVLLSLLRIRVVILWRLEPYRVLSSFSFSFYCNYRRQMFIHLFVLYFNQIN